MKYKYKFHPNQYELGENEQFYSNMECKGWKLVKRGALLSKFEAVEPSRARYRIEVCQFSVGAAEAMPEEQLAVFEDCGWEHVATSLPLQIFRAPAGSDAPEFYVEPEQQAETLKKLKWGATWGWIPGILIAGLYWVICFGLSGSAKIGGNFQRRFVELPPLFFMAGFVLLERFYDNIRNAWLITRTYRRLKKGIPLDHNPRKNRWLHNAVNSTLWGLVVLSGVLVAAQLIGTNSYDMPLESDGPYCLISDLGYVGKRTGFMGHDSGVTASRSLLADFWDTEEYIFIDETHSVFVDQNVYWLRDENMAYWLAEALMKTAVFGGGGENFEPVETDTVDAAWTSRGLEVVAVKGPYVAYVVQTGWSDRFEPLEICDALAKYWN